MKIHEYQAKAILAKFGVAVPRGEVVSKKIRLAQWPSGWGRRWSS